MSGNQRRPPVRASEQLDSAGHTSPPSATSRPSHGHFHRPLRSKNTRGYPSYDGAGARYDWPGYNNGYQNLVKVHCFIYARGGWPPVIAQQPLDRMAGRGGAASFTVVVDGLAPLTYRWQKNGVALADGGKVSGSGTSTLTLTGVDSSDVGLYRCTIGNTYGSVTSREARLAVTCPDYDGDNDVDSSDSAACRSAVASARGGGDCVRWPGLRRDVDAPISPASTIALPARGTPRRLAASLTRSEGS